MPESVAVPQLDLIPMASPNGGERSVDLGSQQNSQAAASNHHEVSENGSPPQMDSPRTTTRDSAWLQVEVCRDFRRDTCPRGEICRFAHPEAKIIGKDGKVTCCYDFLKGRCKRDFCKYYHPPSHIKEKLVNAGKQFGAMMMRYTPPVQPVVMPDGCGLNQVASYYPGGYTDRLPICPEFLLGQCFALVCPFVHPGPFVNQNADQTVTVCRNFVSGVCVRGERCRYYHPLAHHFPTQPFLTAIPVAATQGFIGQPQLVPVMSPPPVPFIPMGVQFPFSPPVTPNHIPVSLAPASSFVPSIPMVPVLSPIPNTSVASLIPAQPVTPVSIIESTTYADVVSVQGSGELNRD